MPSATPGEGEGLEAADVPLDAQAADLAEGVLAGGEIALALRLLLGRPQGLEAVAGGGAAGANVDHLVLARRLRLAGGGNGRGEDNDGGDGCPHAPPARVRAT